MNGFVYFIQEGEGGPVKIGTTGNIRRRLYALRAARTSPLTLLGQIGGGKKREKELHKFFADYRLTGEWFEAAPAFLRQVEDILKVEGVEEDAILPGALDRHTVEARSNAAAIEDFEAERRGISVHEAREVVARELRIAPGTLENLRRDRINHIDSHTFEVLASAYSRMLSKRVVWLQEEYERSIRKDGPDPRDVLRAAELIDSVKGILRAHQLQ